MKINLITPAKKHSRNGNRTSALRWAEFLSVSGHEVAVETDYDGSPCDLMIALHAWRSADAVKRYKTKHPDGALIVALGGTDVNTFLKTEPELTISTMEAADALVCLHDQIREALPKHLLAKLHVIIQSASPLPYPRKVDEMRFDICVIGHLRDEKDPLRAAMAARLMPAASKLQVIHLGKAHNDAWAHKARREQAENPRYHWQGEVSAEDVRAEFAKTRLMVLSSNQEGGANVISEAIVAGVPILASNIPGNTGLLGKSYPGLFPVGDERALAGYLHRTETEPGFIAELQEYCMKLKPRFLPEREALAWKEVIDGLNVSVY